MKTMLLRPVCFIALGLSLWLVGSPAETRASIGPFGGDVEPIVIDPTNPRTIYAGTRGQVFKSTDAGEGWSAVSNGLANLRIWSLAVSPKTATTLYAGTDGGVYKS